MRNWAASWVSLRTEKKSLVKHINIYMEKSLKQREQLEGYLRGEDSWPNYLTVGDILNRIVEESEKEEEDE